MLPAGIAGSFGVAPEATYGGFTPPTRFWEVESARMRQNKTTRQSAGLAAGRTVPMMSRRVVTTRSAGGSVTQEVTNRGMGLLVNMLFGGTVAPVQQGATAAYLQTHQITSTNHTMGKSFTAQSGIPDGAGVVRPYSFVGCKVTKLEFSCGAEEYLTVAADVDARDVVETEPFAEPSYIDGVESFHWDQADVKIGATVAAAVSTPGIRKITAAFERPQATDRYYYGAAGRKAEPVQNDFTKISGTIDADYLDKTVFADRYRDDSPFALVWEFTGNPIEAEHRDTFRLTLPACVLNDEAPTLDGPGMITTPYKWVALNDGTAPPATLELITADTAL